MIISPFFPQARTDNLVTQELPDELLVYDLKTHQAHCLNHTAAAVWKYCDGSTSVPAITALIKRESHLVLDEGTVWQALERLSKANLLKEPIAMSGKVSRAGRRAAIRQIGIGSVMAVPVVMSIVAPTAWAGCTFANDQGYDSFCCTNEQCDPATLECCDGRCKKRENQMCGSDAECCSNNCAGTCQNTSP